MSSSVRVTVSRDNILVQFASNFSRLSSRSWTCCMCWTLRIYPPSWSCLKCFSHSRRICILDIKVFSLLQCCVRWDIIAHRTSLLDCSIDAWRAWNSTLSEGRNHGGKYFLMKCFHSAPSFSVLLKNCRNRSCLGQVARISVCILTFHSCQSYAL